MFSKMVICTAAIQEQFRQYTKDIYMAAYVEMVIYTAAGNQQKTLFTRQPCVHIKYLFTQQPLKCQIGCIHSCRICFQKWLFARQPFKSNFGNIHVCGGLFCGSGVPMSKWLYLHGCHQRVNLAIFTTTGSQQKSLFTRQPCVPH